MVDRYGTSAVVIHSAKGQQYMDSIQTQIKFETVPLASILAGNQAMILSAHPHPRKDLFWQKAIQKQFDCFEIIVDELLVPTKKEKIHLRIVKLKRIGKKLLNNDSHLTQSNKK